MLDALRIPQEQAPAVVGAAVAQGGNNPHGDQRHRTRNVMHLFGWFHIFLFIAQYIFNQIIVWTQYFRNDQWYFFGFSMFFSVVPLVFVSAWALFTAMRNYRRLRRHFDCACLLYFPIINIIVFLSPMMDEHLDIAKLQAVFTFVNLLYITYPNFIINIMYICLYGHIHPYSETSHTSNTVINSYSKNSTSQLVINSHLLICLILLSVMPICIFSYCSVIRARFGFYYADFRLKCQDFVKKFALIGSILLPALLLEIIHFWPLFLEYYYYQSRMNKNSPTDTNAETKFNSNWFLVLLLLFNLPKGLFVPEICTFSKTDFTGFMRVMAFLYSAVTYIPVPLVPFLIRLRRYVTHSESETSIKGRYSAVVTYICVSYGSMVAYFLIFLTWPALGLLTKICVVIIILSMIMLAIGLIFFMPAFSRVTLTWRRSQANDQQ